MDRQRKIIPDLIKILCTVGILFHHYQQFTGTYFYKGINFYGGRFSSGYLVEVFFLLSGWAMLPYINRIKDNMSFWQFYKKRLIRLLPSLIVFTVLYIVAITVYAHFCGDTFAFSSKIDAFGGIITALGLGSWGITKNFYINDVCWYVSVLLFCYILMYVLVYISKRTKISLYILFLLPVIVGVIRNFFFKTTFLPFFTEGMQRGYIHFFGGLILSMLAAQFLPAHKSGQSKKNAPSVFGAIVANVSEALLDIYLVQLSVLLGFFLISHFKGIKLVSGKTMLIFTFATFVIGYLYNFLIGKRIYKLLKNKFDK